jgi:tetratricopeptide (TPR) repeat protein
MNSAPNATALLPSSCVQQDSRPTDGTAPQRPGKPISTDIASSKGHLDSFVRLQAAGNMPAALEAASAACHAAPGVARCHYAYGQAWSALGEHAPAERAFAEAVRLKPGWADAWVNYGIARYHQGAMDDATLAMRHALLRTPGHQAALANLAAFLRLTGGSEASEALLCDSLARDPANAAARLNRVTDLLQEGRQDEALALLDAAPQPTEALALRHHHLSRSLAHALKGEPAPSRAALEACAAVGPLPPELTPLWHWRRLLILLAEGDPAAAIMEAEIVEATLASMGPNALPEHRIMVHFDLAKFWSGRGAHARAFQFWVAAHKLLAISQPFSRAAHQALIDANIATFTRERFLSGPRAPNDDPAPVFIVGMPRTGTTLCEQILAGHRAVHGAGERGALSDMAALLGDGATADAATLDRAAAQYLAALHALAPGKARIVDKMPANYMHLGLVGLMLPGAKIIHCVRDPRDVGLSIFSLRFYGVHSYAHDLGDLGWTIAQQARLMDHWKTVLPNTVLTVALSDWVTDFDTTLARVLAHLDLPPDPACARFHERDSRVRTASRTQVRQPVNARGLGRWQAYEGELAPLIAGFEASGRRCEDFHLRAPHAAPSTALGTKTMHDTRNG